MLAQDKLPSGFLQQATVNTFGQNVNREYPKSTTNDTSSSHTSRERLVAAFVGSIITSLMVTPLDVVKVRLQAAQVDSQSQTRGLFLRNKSKAKLPISKTLQKPGYVINGTMDGVTKIVRHEGIRHLYRGLVPTMVMSVPSTVIYFLGYEWMRDRMLAFGQNELIAPLCSGALARVMAATTVSPIELVRTKMQYHGKHGSVSAVLGLLNMSLHTEGLSVLWKGLVPTLWRDVPFSAIYWVTLESIRGKLMKQISDAERHTGIISFASGALSGILAATLTTPFDVAKTRRQIALANNNNLDGHFQSDASQLSLRLHLRDIWRKEGWRGLFTGLVPRVAKVAPACAIMITSYEMSKELFKRCQ